MLTPVHLDGLRVSATFQIVGDGETPALDWGSCGLPEWLSDRVERLGYRFPTGAVQNVSETPQVVHDGVHPCVQGVSSELTPAPPVRPERAQQQRPRTAPHPRQRDPAAHTQRLRRCGSRCDAAHLQVRNRTHHGPHRPYTWATMA